MATVSISQAGLDLITSFEGCRTKPYKDGGGLWTVGYGQRITAEQAEQWKAGISFASAKSLLHDYLVGECKRLSALPIPQLLQHQQDALISLVYNLGYEYFTEKASIYQRLKERSVNLTQWLSYTKDAKDQEEEGLIKRRLAELRLFIYGVY